MTPFTQILAAFILSLVSAAITAGVAVIWRMNGKIIKFECDLNNAFKLIRKKENDDGK
jgi:hypothetical protein